ncbi:MAG: hypothetical protein LWX83_00655 [Anaerolineae bacterium]|nr:hypothetical protein [Anaerolineae bacterium]
MRKFIFCLFLTLSVVLFCACETGPEGEVDESLWTKTPSPVPSPTETIQWFPPTRTPVTKPTSAQEPTPDKRPGVGAPIFSDAFDEPEHWNTGVGPSGSVAFGKNELTLAIYKSKESLLSLRDAPVLQDFVLEVSTQASLCKDADYYSILFRAMSARDYYRFSAACNGTIRVDRVKSGFSVALVNWTPSGQILPGSPVSLRLGVWMRGKEMRFFVNDVYQFSVTDAVFPSGGVGVYARSMGDSAVTINFSNLAVYKIDEDKIPTSAPTVTITPLPRTPQPANSSQ